MMAGSEGRGVEEIFLPAGTVTLLLADVEGSVRLWERSRDEMTSAVAHLNDLVDRTIRAHSGVRPVEQGEGDSFVAAFARPSDALACACALQLATVDADWPGGLDVRLRVALHTGEVQLRDEGNYMGPAINRAARLRDMGHGRQTLVSRTTHDLVADQLPDSVALADLGTFRLRDLARPEQVFEVRHPAISDNFPPLRSLDVVPNNLPVQLTTFVGRTREIAEVRDVLVRARLVTLTGAGGCGKTRLALQVAAEVPDAFPDGVWMADLSSVNDPRLLPTVVASAIGLGDESRADPIEALAAHLADRGLLLVLDNCEHLSSACAELAALLLQRCPMVKVLATSREPLAVPGETPWRVPSLPVPDTDDDADLTDIGSCESVELFIERAVRARPNFEITEDNASAVAEICQRLDGIPLAIELAAARVRVLTPQQIRDGLVDRFRLLTGGSRTLMPRQQTLQASVDWGYALLTDGQRILLRRLSVFAGGFTLDAAEQVCATGTIGRYDVLDLLSDLVDRSLVQMDEGPSAARYRLLDTIRQYGRDRLVEAEEAVEIRTRHRDFYLTLAERADAEITGHRQERSLATLDVEHDNLRAALEWSRQGEDVEAMATLAARLVLFWRYRGHVREGREWSRAVLNGLDENETSLRAWTLWGLAYLTLFAAEQSDVPMLAEEALRKFVAHGEAAGVARSLMVQGWAAIQVTQGKGAQAALEKSRDLAREIGDVWCLAGALEGLGQVNEWSNPGAAREYLEEAMAVARRAGDDFRLRWLRAWFSLVAFVQGRFVESKSIAEEILPGLRLANDRVFYGAALGHLGITALHLGQYDYGRRCLEEAVTLGRELDSFILAVALSDLARTKQIGGDLDAARDLVAEAYEMSITFAAYRGYVMWTFACIEIARDALDHAAALLDEAMAYAGETDITYVTLLCLEAYARLHRARGDDKRAENAFHQALEIEIDVGDQARVADTLEGLAAIAAAAESFKEAARLMGAARTLRESAAYVRFPWYQAAYDETVTAARRALGAEKFDAALAEGASMSFDEAVAYARRGRGERKRPTAGWDSLTPAEFDVVALVAEGLTNPQIGERLFVSKRTVQTHLYRVFAKVGVSSRAELAAEVARRNVAKLTK